MNERYINRPDTDATQEETMADYQAEVGHESNKESLQELFSYSKGYLDQAAAELRDENSVLSIELQRSDAKDAYSAILGLHHEFIDCMMSGKLKAMDASERASFFSSIYKNFRTRLNSPTELE